MREKGDACEARYSSFGNFLCFPIERETESSLHFAEELCEIQETTFYYMLRALAEAGLAAQQHWQTQLWHKMVWTDDVRLCRCYVRLCRCLQILLVDSFVFQTYPYPYIKEECQENYGWSDIEVGLSIARQYISTAEEFGAKWDAIAWNYSPPWGIYEKLGSIEHHFCRVASVHTCSFNVNGGRQGLLLGVEFNDMLA